MKPLSKSAHAVHRLSYHVVLVTKYRNRALSGQMTCIVSCGGAPLEVVRRYIASQRRPA